MATTSKEGSRHANYPLLTRSLGSCGTAALAVTDVGAHTGGGAYPSVKGGYSLPFPLTGGGSCRCP